MFSRDPNPNHASKLNTKLESIDEPKPSNDGDRNIYRTNYPFDNYLADENNNYFKMLEGI